MSLRALIRLTAAAVAVCIVISPAAPAGAGTPSGAMAAPASGILSKQAFADRFLAALKKAAPDLKITARSVEDFDVALPGGATGQIYLGNAYQDYTGDPDQLDEIIGRMVRMTQQMGVEQKFEAAQLRVLLRPEAYTMIDPKKQDTPAKRQVSRPFAGDLYLIIGADQPESIAFPARKDLEGLAPGGEEGLWKLALENTRKVIAETAEIEDLDGILMIKVPGLAGGALLDDGFWSRREFAGRGDLVALVMKDFVLVAHDGDDEAIGVLRDYIADELAAGHSLISQVLLVRRNGRWEVLTP